jgi:hypothetical protein
MTFKNVPYRYYPTEPANDAASKENRWRSRWIPALVGFGIVVLALSTMLIKKAEKSGDSAPMADFQKPANHEDVPDFLF